MVSAAISRELSALRASPSATLARCRKASSSAWILTWPKPAFRVGQGAAQQLQQILFSQRLQFKNLRARNQRGIDKEKWIMRRGPNQPHHPALHVRQQDVLLRLVKAVNFVNEQDGRLPRVFQAVACRRQHPAHVGHIGFHAAEPFKFAAGLPGDDLGQGSFARAGRPVENERLNAIRLNGPAQQLSGRQDMRLAREFIQVARPHPRRQRLLRQKASACVLGIGGSGSTAAENKSLPVTNKDSRKGPWTKREKHAEDHCRKKKPHRNAVYKQFL